MRYTFICLHFCLVEKKGKKKMKNNIEEIIKEIEKPKKILVIGNC